MVERLVGPLQRQQRFVRGRGWRLLASDKLENFFPKRLSLLRQLRRRGVDGVQTEPLTTAGGVVCASSHAVQACAPAAAAGVGVAGTVGGLAQVFL